MATHSSILAWRIPGTGELGGLPSMGSHRVAQGNRLSCRDQEGRRGSEEAMPGPSVFPSGEPGVSGDFWARGLCRGAAGNPRFPRLLPGTLGNFPGCL